MYITCLYQLTSIPNMSRIFAPHPHSNTNAYFKFLHSPYCTCMHIVQGLFFLHFCVSSSLSSALLLNLFEAFPVSFISVCLQMVFWVISLHLLSGLHVQTEMLYIEKFNFKVHIPLQKFSFVLGFSSHLKIFHSYGEVTITVEGLQVLTCARHSWTLSSEGS